MGAWMMARCKRLDPVEMLDVLSPGLMLGRVVGRIGCILNACCYGRPSDLAWSTPLPDGLSGLPVWRHPSPLYEAFLALALVGALAWWLSRRRFNGEMFLAMAFLYSGVRLGAEFF